MKAGAKGMVIGGAKGMKKAGIVAGKSGMAAGFKKGRCHTHIWHRIH